MSLSLLRGEEIKSNSEQRGVIGIKICGEDFLDLKDVTPGGPADTAGIVPGDYLTHVDGVSVMGDSFDEVLEKLGGTAGTDLTVTLKETDSGKSRDVTVTRVAASDLPKTEPEDQPILEEKELDTSLLPDEVRMTVTSNDESMRTVVYRDGESLLVYRLENIEAGKTWSVAQKLYLDGVAVVVLERRTDGGINMETIADVPANAQVLRDNRDPHRWIIYTKDYSAILAYFSADENGMVRPFGRAEFEAIRAAK